jgi:hypothetical protein
MCVCLWCLTGRAKTQKAAIRGSGEFLQKPEHFFLVFLPLYSPESALTQNLSPVLVINRDADLVPSFVSALPQYAGHSVKATVCRPQYAGQLR